MPALPTGHVERWKLLKGISDFPTGTELECKGNGWYLVDGDELRPVEHSLGKLLDGLAATPNKNWMERIGVSS